MIVLFVLRRNWCVAEYWEGVIVCWSLFMMSWKWEYVHDYNFCKDAQETLVISSEVCCL